MGSRVQKKWQLALAVVLVLGLLGTAAGMAVAAGPKAAQSDRPQSAEAVDMFAAIQDGRIEVQLVPKDSTQCRVNVRNKTDQPLTLQLPDAFAAVPVLAQAAGGRTGGRSGGGGGRGGGAKGAGGGMGGMGGMGGRMGGGGMGGGMGMMNIAPEKVEHFNVPIVCLEHGKRDPQPAVKYEIRPIDQFTDKAGVRELLSMVGSGQIPQRVAQVAAWHLNNDMSWEDLAAKKLRLPNGVWVPYFSPDEIRAAVHVSTLATTQAEQHKKAEPPKSYSESTPSASVSRN